ncbi:FACT complex subunit SSRP1-like [Carassius gibelio]|uniref:FACT complex subunit SSRP1-like n=1 Tax=Carassius gibelio TaxID=101364 RepID=UPI0022773FBA|nr:FACT complex subunit SSRP1-like [Carassius gibelio]
MYIDSDDDQHDAYLERMKEEGKIREKANDSDDPEGESEKEKDSSALKRPMSAYMLWLNSSRDRIKSENPGISVTEISKKAGEMWKQIGKEKKERSNDEEEVVSTPPSSEESGSH